MREYLLSLQERILFIKPSNGNAGQIGGHLPCAAGRMLRAAAHSLDSACQGTKRGEQHTKCDCYLLFRPSGIVPAELVRRVEHGDHVFGRDVGQDVVHLLEDEAAAGLEDFHLLADMLANLLR
jgi:hypothetical protein